MTRETPSQRQQRIDREHQQAQANGAALAVTAVILLLAAIALAIYFARYPAH